MRRHVFCREFTTNDGLSQDGIGGCNTRRNGETGQKLKVRDHCPDKQRCNEPSPLTDIILIRRV